MKNGITAQKTIPLNRELAFLLKLIVVITTGSLVAFALLYIVLNQEVGADYRTAFHTISDAYTRMNVYIMGAVFVQLLISSFVVYVLALHYSHKIAGPMYRLKIIIQQYTRGENVEKLSFRKTDFLHDVAGEFTDFFSCQRQRDTLFQKIDDLLAQLDVAEEKQKSALLQQFRKILDDLEKTYHS